MRNTLFLSVLCCHMINGFVLNVPLIGKRALTVSAPLLRPEQRMHGVKQDTRLFAKLWDRMALQDDEEPLWYLLNCVAGLEMDLLRQCRQRCEDMEDDVVKFVVPVERKTRSHGPNRMVTENKVKYPSYVFAKLRLCGKTYEAIQDLDLCRSWMGTVNHRGYKKLPPSPLPLNEDEIENFKLEDISEDDPDFDVSDDPILDDIEQDKKDKENEQTELLKVFLGLKVEDMVKVTAKGKFFNEDGIIRRLKDDRILVKFFTYGTMYEEWLDPSNVRKLDDAEVLKGLGGPSKPVTQEDIDGPQPGDRYQYGDSGKPGDRNLVGGLQGGGTRNRREDRTARGQSEGERVTNDKNWNNYKENQREQQGGGYSDGQSDIRGSRDGGNRDGGNRNRERGAQSDVDAQWGRTSQRQNRQDKRNTAENTRIESAVDAGADWSAFVSPASSPISKEETDDFFSSLMTDLSKGLDKDSSSGKSKKDAGSANSGSDEDDFFASLMSEISQDETKGPKREKPDAARASDEDAFFDNLMSDISADEEAASKNEKSETSKTAAAVSPSSDDDFFSSLEAELVNTREAEPASSKPKPKKQSGAKAAPSGVEDDFFASLEAELGNTLTESKSAGVDKNDDFFSGLEADLASELGSSSAKASPKVEVDGDDFFDSLEADIEAEKPKPKKKVASPKKASSSPVPEASSAAGKPPAADFQKRTVPELKELLRERGMKVSGKKSELIERLS